MASSHATGRLSLPVLVVAAVGGALLVRGAGPAASSPTSAAIDPAARALTFAVTVEGEASYGAGVLVRPAAGLVLTADHVIAEMRHPRVSFADGTTFPARVVERDAALDLALLEIAPQRRPGPVLLADAAAVHPGDAVLAIGCPRHLPFSVARGVVSFVDRPFEGGRWLQTDIAINDGNSGGPVVDAEGRLVAVMSFILRNAQGLSFALPIATALRRFPALHRTDER